MHALIIAAGIVFVLNAAGSFIEFNNRFVNALVDTVLFAGVNVDQCVLATLIDANCLGYDCVLLSDCCATTSPSFCTDATYYNVKQCFGFVAVSTDLITGLSAGGGEPE